MQNYEYLPRMNFDRIKVNIFLRLHLILLTTETLSPDIIFFNFLSNFVKIKAGNWRKKMQTWLNRYELMYSNQRRMF